MSVLPRNTFMMSFGDKFTLVGLFCDFCKCQEGDICSGLFNEILVDSYHGLSFPSTLICFYLTIWAICEKKVIICDVEYEIKLFEASLHIIDLAQPCELRTQVRIT